MGTRSTTSKAATPTVSPYSLYMVGQAQACHQTINAFLIANVIALLDTNKGGVAALNSTTPLTIMTLG